MPKRDSAPTGAPCWLELFTSDTDKGRAFYGELFGWTSEEAGEEYGGYINFLKDGVRVAGCMRNDGSAGVPDLWSVYLATDDAQKVTEAASANGGQVIVPAMEVGELGTHGGRDRSRRRIDRRLAARAPHRLRRLRRARDAELVRVAHS